MDVFCSTIIPTISRPTLTAAVNSVLNQSFQGADFEVIVVNDSGHPLPEMDWQDCERVRVIETMRRERSVARNTGAALARGQYLHFLDDDDVLLPGAFDAFWTLAQETKADWLLGAWRTVDNNRNIVAEYNPPLLGNIFALLVSGEGLPLQASLLNTKIFFKAGAFDPTLVGTEDRDLGRRFTLIADLAFTSCVAAEIRIGQVGSSTNWGILAESDRWGREKALSTAGAFQRLQKSSDPSHYWRGRVSRSYFASSVWNLKHKNYLTSLSRLLSGISFTGYSSFHTDFWEGLRTRIK